jgi:RimJ/RimL family protein N-acetyltransferase
MKKRRGKEQRDR